MKRRSTSLMLTESALMLAFATVLSLVKIIDMPYGGSVSAASMLPIILIAYRYGTPWGLLTAFAASLMQLLLGLNNLSYATSFAAAVAILLLDYVVAFTAMGLGGVFRKVFKSQSTALVCGTLLVCAIRYICHVISGCTVWAGVSIPSQDGLIYSLGYNAVYMVPETIITVVAAFYMGRMLDFRKDSVTRLPEQQGQLKHLVGGLILAATAVFDALYLFSTVQVENADGDTVFSIAGMANANWTLLIVVTLGAIAMFLLNQKARPFAALGTAVVYDVIVSIVAAAAGTSADIKLMLTVSAVCVVIALLMWNQILAAIPVSAVLVIGIHTYGRLSAGKALAAKDWILFAVVVVCAAVGTALFARLKRNHKKTA